MGVDHKEENLGPGKHSEDVIETPQLQQQVREQ